MFIISRGSPFVNSLIVYFAHDLTITSPFIPCSLFHFRNICCFLLHLSPCYFFLPPSPPRLVSEELSAFHRCCFFSTKALSSFLFVKLTNDKQTVVFSSVSPSPSIYRSSFATSPRLKPMIIAIALGCLPQAQFTFLALFAR